MFDHVILRKIILEGVFYMDRLSYKDGYLTGAYQALNTLLKDGIISIKQCRDYKDRLFNDEIIVPETYQF